jgi:nucleoid-associated protein YgaU
MLREKYSDLMNLAAQLKMQGLEANEDAGKLKIRGTATYQLDKDLLWDKIKSYSNWENEVGADIRVERTDIYGMYTVQPGDTLSKLAKGHLGDPMKYMEIFNINKDILTNPDLIKVGQVLKLPNK